MIVLVPMNGSSLYESLEGFAYPKILTEVGGLTIFEHSQIPLKQLPDVETTVFVVPKGVRQTLSLDPIIKMVGGDNAVILDALGETGGALCSCLLAIDYLQCDDELVISSADHFFDEDVEAVVAHFRERKADAGVLVFDSVHPKWSYAKIDPAGVVKQTAEKELISRDAMVGFFYFAKALDFVEAGKEVIRKQNQKNGSYFVSSAINELILSGKKVHAKKLESRNYFSFYDAHSIRTFENVADKSIERLERLTRDYIRAFDAGDLSKVVSFFAEDATLVDPNVNVQSAVAIEEFLRQLFAQNKIRFIERDIIASKDRSVIEFDLYVNEQKHVGVDVIKWSEEKIVGLAAYLYPV